MGLKAAIASPMVGSLVGCGGGGSGGTPVSLPPPTAPTVPTTTKDLSQVISYRQPEPPTALNNRKRHIDPRSSLAQVRHDIDGSVYFAEFAGNKFF